MNIRNLLVATFVSTLAICGSAMAADIEIHGSTTVAGNLVSKHEAEIEAQSGQQINIVSNGSGQGLTDLGAGTAQIAMISAPLEEVAAKVSADASQFVAKEVGQVDVAFVVHPSNAVKSLTMAQITDILSGKIKNWKEVGGADAPILVVTEVAKGGLRSLVEEHLLAKAPISANMRELANGSQIMKISGQIPQALGITTKGLVDATVTNLTTDSMISAPFILVTKGEATAEQAKVIAAAEALAK